MVDRVAITPDPDRRPRPIDRDQRTKRANCPRIDISLVGISGTASTMDAQTEIVEFLSRPSSHGPEIRDVERLETHGAYVFLVGDEVFKVKRAVRYPYLDFSTLEKRKSACSREVTLNRRTAPDLYLGTTAIVRDADGTLAIGGEGEVVEWAVRMRRFPQEALFDHMAGEGTISFELCRQLARKIASLHQSAEVSSGKGSGARQGDHRGIAEGNIATFKSRPDLFPPVKVEALDRSLRSHLRAHAGLLERRRADGHVRHCHGDLHLRNICMFKGEPTLFDCLEFDDDLATVDVLYDLAFLLMDMDQHALKSRANAVLNHYLEITGETEGLACLPLFLAQRAAVRAKVAADTNSLTVDAERKAGLAREAIGYLEAALVYTNPTPPMLIGIGGFSGSGKTRVSRALAPRLGASPGAVHLRSDQIRKALFGVAEEQKLPPESYLPEVSEQVYQIMLERGALILRAGRSVILDAVFNHPASREAAEAMGSAASVPFHGLWLEAPRDLLSKRVADRRNDASDATIEIVQLQTRQRTGPISWQRIDASGDVETVAAKALAVLSGAELMEINAAPRPSA